MQIKFVGCPFANNIFSINFLLYNYLSWLLAHLFNQVLERILFFYQHRIGMAGVLSRSKSLKLFLLRVILDYSIIFGLNSSKEIGIHSTVLSISKSLRTNNWKFSILLFSIYGFQPSFQVSQRWFKSKYMISVAGISC